MLGWFACAAAIAAAGAFFSLALAYNLYQRRAAQFDLTRINEVSQRSLVYDCNGEFYSYLHGENRLVIPLNRVSPHFIDALLAREDARFWKHDGVDMLGVVRAAWTNLRAGDVREGASTLTQQLARGAFQMKERSIDRKALEALLARRIEKKFSKKQILEFYVNRIYFGSGFYGIEAAARGYFGKPATELTLAESAMLAGLIRSPNKLSPLRDMKASQEQAETVLERLHALHFITEDELAAAKQATPSVAQQRTMRFEDNYVMDAVKREVEALLPPEVVALGGLRIFTTIDFELQQRAEAAADRKLSEIESAKNYSHPKKADFDPGPEDSTNPAPTKYLQAALVAIDNRTGAIRAIVGGRDYRHSKYPRALLARRQIGSTFKPFVYGAAFESGLLPGTLVDDSRIGPGELRNASNNWSPENSDDEYAGLQPAGWGLLKSRNTMAVRVGQMAGIPAVRKVAAAAGVGERIPDLPVAFLGAFETTLRELTAAYTVFPNLGVRRPAHLVARIESADGEIIHQPDQTERRALSAESAWMVSWVLQHVMKTGTASKAVALGWKSPGAGKTGTTNDFFDAWFVGYTTSLTCGVWVGMDEPQTIMERGYGSALALPIWVDFMKEVPQRTYPAAAFSQPARLFVVRVCSASGGRATAGCEQLRLAYETQLPPSRTPMQWCAQHPHPHPPAYFAEAGAAPSLPPMQSHADGSTAGVSMPPASAAATVSHIAASSDPARDGVTTIQEPGAPPVILRDRQTTRQYHVPPPAELPPDRIQFPPEGVRVLRAVPVRRSERVFYDGRVWRAEVVREPKRRIIRVAPPAEAE